MSANLEPHEAQPPVMPRVFIIYVHNGKVAMLEGEHYANDGQGVYFKARRPGGGTVEVHVLAESHFSDHPDASEQA